MKMPEDLFELSKNFPRREDMKRCEPCLSDYYRGDAEVYRFRPKFSTKALAVPNPLQEFITRHLDVCVDQIKAWLDADHSSPSYIAKDRYLLKIPILSERHQDNIWSRETGEFPDDALSRIKNMSLCLRRRTLVVKTTDVYLWSYAAVTDYGHIILGKIRQRALHASVITEQGMRLGD